MEQFRSLLAHTQPGRIDDPSQLSDALAKCWDKFEGSDADGMAAYKLDGRMEEVEWQPPILTFKIERHGGTVLGSSKAEIHFWTLDVEQSTATSVRDGYRQVRPRQPPLDVRPMAKEIAVLIQNRQADRRLKWYEDGRVRVKIGDVLPEKYSPKQTREERRARFWTQLDAVLQPDWERQRQTYSRKTR